MKTVSLETAKKLKEAGLELDTYFVWTNTGNLYIKQTGNTLWQTADFTGKYDLRGVYFPAPTLDELLEVMPCYTNDNENYLFGMLKSTDNKRYYAYYRNGHHFAMVYNGCTLYCCNENPAEAVAELWLKLKANKLV